MVCRYYSLPYCRPEKIVQSAENLGEVLRGDRIENSLYQVCYHAHNHLAMFKRSHQHTVTLCASSPARRYLTGRMSQPGTAVSCEESLEI